MMRIYFYLWGEMRVGEKKNSIEVLRNWIMVSEFSKLEKEWLNQLLPLLVAAMKYNRL